MAGSTNNYHFIKPADDEAADNTPLNTNFDNIDAALGAHDDALAIVSDGNTHAAITAGQFVYVRNHGTLANGLYTANSNISANATLSSSNLTADSYGGLNALNAKITDITDIPIIDGANIGDVSNIYTKSLKKIGNLCILNLDLKFGASISGDTEYIFIVPSAYAPSQSMRGAIVEWNNSANCTIISVGYNGQIAVLYAKANTEYTGSISWFI